MSIPPIPDISGDVDLLLAVHTHRSLRSSAIPEQMNETYGNTDRLAELGATALDLSIESYLFSLRPLLSGREMRVSISYILVYKYTRVTFA